MYKRASFLYGLFAFTIGLLIIGIFKITLTYSVSASKLKSEKKKILCSSRGYIYDRNYHPLVNTSINNKSFPIDRKTSVNEIEVQRYSANQLCSHLIGYTDAENNGISGIEKCYDDVLSYYSGDISVSYYSSAVGDIIGELGKPKYNNYLSKGGVVLTIDKYIQYVTEKCVDDAKLEKGAAAVLEVKTGEILALCSRPNINQNEIEKYLNDEASPLINRALTEYSVGSVFKPIIAAVALENGADPDEEYNCDGDIKIGDTVFPCHNLSGHGKLDLFHATAESCNTFYINLTKDINASYLLNTARNFGFGSKCEIADGLFTDSGVLPEEKDMSSGEKANLSFGQGMLSATPVHLAAAYATIGNKGIYNPPIVIKSFVDENITEYKIAKNNSSRRVISEKTANTVLKALKMTVEEGSGKNASPANTTAVGKTATAQSGWFENGREITHSWFVGMFPAQEPRYVIAIVKEDGISGSYDCAPIFKDIAQLVISYE